MERSQEKEWMDLGPEYYTKEEYNQCLGLLFKVNQLTGMFADTVKLLRQFPADSFIVDVGCGGGLFLLNLSRHFPNMTMLGLDISKEAIDYAQRQLLINPKNNVSFQWQQQPELQLPKDSVDIILLTLVAHHLKDEELINLLKNALAATRYAIIINELQRHAIAYWFYKIISPLLFRSKLITHDGLVSIQRSYKRKELEQIIRQVNPPHYQIKWRFPFRWSIILWKN